MNKSILSLQEVLAGYDAISQIYPHVPPMCIWRAWEYAAYQRYTLPEPVLDVGCGDGHFFRLVWPAVQDVTGVDMDPGVAELARRTGVYRAVYNTRADRLPFPPETFASAFANCSLEHMDDLAGILRSIHRSLRPGGSFLLSVVTDKFTEWATLPLLTERIGEPHLAGILRKSYEAHHHLVNALELEAWIEVLQQASFTVEEFIPIVPEMTGRFFLFLDHLWHVEGPSGEVGDTLRQYLSEIPAFTAAFRQILSGFLQMDSGRSTGSGLVFRCCRNGV